MQVTFTFRNVDSSEALKNFATEKISKLEKYMHADFAAEVTLYMERHLHCVDITVTSGSHTYSSQQESEDMYASIDMAIDRIDGQIRRTKDAENHRKRSAVGIGHIGGKTAK